MQTIGALLGGTTGVVRNVTFLLCLSTLPQFVHAQDREFGAGVILGEPTGLSGKMWVSQKNAFDGGLAWGFGRGGRLHIHADYLWHINTGIQSSERFSFYIGVGGRLATGDGNGILGVRIPLGFVWLPRNAPLDVFLELVPIVDLVPSTGLSSNAGIGIRYFFP